TAAAWSGKSPWHRNALAPEAVASQTTSSGIRRKLVGTQTAPSRKAANIDQNISSQFLECTRMRSPFPIPRAASAAASAVTCASISRQLQDLSAQMKPARLACRREFWVSACARFVTRRDIRAWLPSGRSASGGAALMSAASHEHAGADQDEANHAGNDAMLHVHPAHAFLVAGEETGKLIGRNQEISRSNDKQDDADQGQHELHEVS